MHAAMVHIYGSPSLGLEWMFPEDIHPALVASTFKGALERLVARGWLERQGPETELDEGKIRMTSEGLKVYKRSEVIF
jgi:hypothetical protein